MEGMNMIRQFYGWETSKGTIAPQALINLFNKPAEFILVVPEDMFDSVITFLRMNGWMYLVKQRTRDVVIALQYNKKTRII